MKTIVNIARNELRQLFYSPIAWVLLVVFFVIVGSAFTSVFGAFTRYIAAGWQASGDITMTLFGSRGLFNQIQGYLYLFIPLLTMGLVSKEKSSGTNKLLMSSPVRHSSIVLGKFGAMAAYGLVLFSILFIVVAFSAVTVKAFDIKPVLAGLLGLYLLMLAYSAIGIFMSSITRYQIVAAVGTIALLFLMNYSTRVWQDIPFIRDLTFWIGISGRADTFIGGLISSEDLIYFITIIAMFLGLTTLVMRFETVRESTGRKVLKYGLVVVAAFAIGFVSSRPKLMAFYDATRMKSQTLTEPSQQAMKMMEGPLTITTYVNLLQNDAHNGLPASYNYDVSRFSQYRRFKPEIKMKYVYYYYDTTDDYMRKYEEDKTLEERAKDRAKSLKTKMSLWKTPEEIDAIIDLKDENYGFVRILERGNGNQSRLRIYADMYRHPSETEITAAMKRLVVKPPKVGFVTGHGERGVNATGERGYALFSSSKTFRSSLVNQGFDIDTVSLAKAIPDDIDILVVADPREAYSQAELDRIDSYISAGGNLLVAVKSGNRRNLEPLLGEMGVSLLPGVLVNDNPGYTPNLTVADITPDAAERSKVYRAYAGEGYKIVAPRGVGLKFDPSKGFTGYEIAVAEQNDGYKIWNELQTTDFENHVPTLDTLSGETVQNAVPVILGLERNVSGRQQKIVVLGDADIIGNGELMTSRNKIKAGNFAVIMGSFSWLTDDEFPVDTSRQPGPDDEFKYITRKDRGWMDVLFIGILPGIIALLGIILLVRRKGK